MRTVALSTWVVRPPRWLSLFQNLMIVSAALATAVSFRSALSDSVAASGEVVVSLALLGVILMVITLKRRIDAKARKPRSVERAAASHWRVIFDDGSYVDGSLRHAWRGWAWLTLRIQSPGSRNDLEFTVWRATVSAAAWHQLQVWTAWELAMIRSGRSRRNSVEPF